MDQFEVFPADGSETGPTPRIGARVRLEDELRRDSRLDASTVRLELDGIDVTDQAELGGTQDFPQSLAEIAYTPPAALRGGEHSAALAVGGSTVTWTFRVAG